MAEDEKGYSVATVGDKWYIANGDKLKEILGISSLEKKVSKWKRHTIQDYWKMSKVLTHVRNYTKEISELKEVLRVCFDIVATSLKNLGHLNAGNDIYTSLDNLGAKEAGSARQTEEKPSNLEEIVEKAMKGEDIIFEIPIEKPPEDNLINPSAHLYNDSNRISVEKADLEWLFDNLKLNSPKQKWNELIEKYLERIRNEL